MVDWKDTSHKGLSSHPPVQNNMPCFMQAHASVFCSPNELVHLSGTQILSYFMNNSEKQVTEEIKPHFWQAVTIRIYCH